MFAKLFLLLICLIAIIPSVRALPGDLDSTFGVGGIVTYRLNDFEDTFQGVVVQPDGKIVVTGKNGNGKIIVIRYNANGSFDTSFANAGIYVATNITVFASSTAIALQPDGKIVVSGIYAMTGNDNAYLLIRLNTDGSPDTTLGGQGFVITNISAGNDMSRDIAVQPDGKILICGSVNDMGTTGSDIGLVRFLPNGNLDLTFNDSGIVITSITVAEQGYALKLQTDGKIVVLANSDDENTSTYYQALVRYLADGTLDPEFGTNGIALDNLNGLFFTFGDLAIQSDGNIVTTTSIGNTGTFTFAFTVARYYRDGSTDINFGTNGKTLIISETSNSAQALEIQSNGKIIVVGHTEVPNNGLDILVARLNPNGTLDLTFGNGGRVFTQVAPAPLSDFSFDVALQADGKIVVAGKKNLGTLSDFDAILFRYMGGDFPSPQKTFDFDGDSKTDISIFRPTGGEWWYIRSSDNQNRAFQFGNPTDKLVPADYTGDGKTDIAVFTPSTREWFVLRSEDSSFYSFTFGAEGDIPQVGDFDGDGKADAAVFRQSSALWFILLSSGGTRIQQFGSTTDFPAVADYDGDGKADIAIIRFFGGLGVEWWWYRSSVNSTIAYVLGTPTDIPVRGDYTGDGKADVSFWRPSTGEWFVLRSESPSYYAAPFGATGDIPVPGDYDGDGTFDFAVFRPSNQTWYLLKSTEGFTAVQFGLSTDKPVPTAFFP